MQKIKLTRAAVARLPLATSGQYIVRDSELANFFVVIGKREKTFTWQVDSRVLGKRTTTRRTVGRASDTDPAAARKVAKLEIAKLQSGQAAPSNGAPITLGAAWTAFREQFESQVAAGTKRPASLRSYRHAIEGILADWEDATLRDLSDDPQRVAARHVEITKAHGSGTANTTLRCLRMIYHFAAKTRMERDLPAGLPTDAINWNPERRRETGMTQADLAGWHAQLRAMDSPVREEFHMMTLLSGSRPNALRQAKWEWLDVAAKTLTFPASVMKGKRVFVMPLSGPMIRCLARARRAGRLMHGEAGKTYIFPGPTSTGHLGNPCEDRRRLSHWGGDLRQTYAIATKAIGLDGYSARTLLNHATGDVHDGYAAPSALGHMLREAQSRVSTYMMAGMGGK